MILPGAPTWGTSGGARSCLDATAVHRPWALFRFAARKKRRRADFLGGLPEKDDSLLKEPVDAGGLAVALLQLIRQSEVRAQLSQRARLSARRFDFRRNVEKAMVIYDELVRTRTHAPVDTNQTN